MSSGPGITRLGQIQIGTRDVERASDFYEKVLGLKLLFKAPPGLAFFDCNGVRLMLDRPEKPEFAHASSILYFVVPDIQAAHAAMKEKGVRFDDEPHMIAPARSRSLDDLLPRHGRQPAGADERSETISLVGRLGPALDR